MPRKYKPVELPLKSVTGLVAPFPRATCPKCEAGESTVLGRLGRRLVFRCSACQVRFFRPNPAPQNQFG